MAAESQLLSIGPFLGLDSSTASYYLDAQHGTDMLNVVPNRKYASYQTARGRVHAFSSQFASQLYGLTKFDRFGTSTVYLAAANNAGVGVIQYAALGGAPSTISLPTALTASKRTSFIKYQNWAFLANGTDAPLKIDQGLTATRWGVTPPSSAITAAAGATGNLLGTYQWTATFGNSTLESSPGFSGTPQQIIASNQLSLNNQAASLTNIPVSTDPQVTTVNLYRIGGIWGKWLYVGSVSNGTTTFTDNLADSNIVGQNLILHRDPPQPFYAIEVHKDRIWGFGYNAQPSDLWYSNFAEPWGFDNTNSVIPLGRNLSGDNAVGLASLGSILVAFKNKSTWIVRGDTPQDFQYYPVIPVGCVSPLSITKAQGVVYWLSEEGAWVFDGSSAHYISKQIHSALSGMSLADLQAAVGFFYDYIWYLSFPTQGITYGYNTLTQEWHKLGWACDAATFDPENLNEVTASEVGTGWVDSWFAAETDLGSAITSTYTSFISDSGAPQMTKRYRHAILMATVQSGATATLQVIIDPGPTQKTSTKLVNLGIGPPRHALSLPVNLIGFQCQVTVTVTSSAQTEIQKIEVHGWPERQYASQG